MSPSEFHVEIVAKPAQADVDAVLAGLRAFNWPHMGEVHREPIGCFARNDAGAVIGGVVGKIDWGWLTVEQLWVHDDYRGRGLGRELMERAEQYAAERGVRRVRVETTSFQSLDFYRTLGYEVFAELPECPPGAVNYYLKKVAE